MNTSLSHLEVTWKGEKMLKHLVASFIKNFTQRGSSWVIDWCSLLFLVSGRQTGKGKMGGITLNTDKILALPVLQGSDWLNLAPLSFQV